MDSSIAQARALGRVEGRAEALEEVAALHAEIAALHGRIEDILLARDEQTKELMSNVYKEIKATFKQCAIESVTPKQAVDLCKPCLRRVAEQHLGPSTARSSSMPASRVVHRESSDDTVDSHPLMDDSDSHLHPPTASHHHRQATVPPLNRQSSWNDPMPTESHPLMDTSSNLQDEAAPLSAAPPTIDVELDSPQNVVISGCEKIGSGHLAYMVYCIELHDEGTVLCRVKRRYRDFVWLSDRLAATYLHACIPTLPPKNALQSRFNPTFTDKRKRILERWLQHIHLHYALGLSAAMRAFFHDAVLSMDGLPPPLLGLEPPAFKPPFRRRSPSNDKRVDQTFKQLQEPLPQLQRRLQAVSKRSDALVRAQGDLGGAVESMRQHLYQVHAFEWAQDAHVSPWEAWRQAAPLVIQFQKETAQVWDVYIHEPFAFQHDHVLPRFERQVTDVGKDMTASKVEKTLLEWDELQYVRAKTLVASLLHAATSLQDKHKHMRDEWCQLKQQVQVDAGDERRRREEEGSLPFVHPTLDRPLKPQSSLGGAAIDEDGIVDNDDDAANEARTLFGEAGKAATLFGNMSSSEDDDESPPLVHQSSRDWDKYIARMRRKQKSKAEAVAEQKQAAQAAAEEATRKVKKRPQSLNWPVKRSSHLRLDERVKQQSSFSVVSPPGGGGGGIHRSASTSDCSDPTDLHMPEPLPPQPVRTTSVPAVATNWIPVQTPSGQEYYYHKVTRATRWTKPEDHVIASIEERIQAQHDATARRLQERQQWHEDHRLEQEKEAEEADVHRRAIDLQVTAWASQHKDVVGMLNGLHDIFPFKDTAACHVALDGGGTTPSPSAVKKAYMKAVRQLHPDKLLPAEFSLRQRMLGQHLFSTLTSAYEKYQATCEA
ncbi:Aste57867_24543 [Aphanomyces stellatus]|uniref:Aste57867_24543 protein n=1 Tax=Aphanomyces stellatus TaxID=120398 RepID=A0A485LQN0_9STRA|nr:hypothetical protein As57867_024466 [Aphanomyces stellatus]VFU01182.1 Aste57867_24543 [Aphanomyces stellatus]